MTKNNERDYFRHRASAAGKGGAYRRMKNPDNYDLIDWGRSDEEAEARGQTPESEQERVAQAEADQEAGQE